MQLLWIWGNWLRCHAHEMRKGGAQLGVWRDQCCNKQQGGVQLGVWRDQCCNKLQQRSHEMGKGGTQFGDQCSKKQCNHEKEKKRRPIGCLERPMMSIAKKIDGRPDLT